MKIEKNIFLVAIIFAFFYQNILKAQDIIVLNDGSLIKSNVKELGLAEIKYQREDQKDGPVYSLLKSKIFAIHYSDGTKDVFSSGDAAISNVNKRLNEFLIDTVPDKDIEDLFVKKNIFLHIGSGMYKIYSPTNEIGLKNFKTTSSYKEFNLGLGITTNTVFGLSYAEVSYSADAKFNDRLQFTETNFDAEQKISCFTLWGRYYAKTKYDYFRPYAVLGISLNNSDVISDIKTTTEDEDIVFNRGGKITDISTLLKMGVEFDIMKNFPIYAEVGFGTVLINIGIGYRIIKKN